MRLELDRSHTDLLDELLHPHELPMPAVLRECPEICVLEIDRDVVEWLQAALSEVDCNAIDSRLHRALEDLRLVVGSPGDAPWEES